MLCERSGFTCATITTAWFFSGQENCSISDHFRCNASYSRKCRGMVLPLEDDRTLLLVRDRGPEGQLTGQYHRAACWGGCSIGPRSAIATGRSPSGRDVPLDGNVSGMLSRYRHVVSELHAEKVVHIGTEGLFDAQGHFRRERRLAVEEVGERGAAHFQNLRRLRHVETEGFDDLGSDQVARMGRVFHGHFRPPNDSRSSRGCQQFRGRAKVSATCRPSWVAPLWRCRLRRAAEAPCAESGQNACQPFMIPIMYGYTVHVKRLVPPPDFFRKNFQPLPKPQNAQHIAT